MHSKEKNWDWDEKCRHVKSKELNPGFFNVRSGTLDIYSQKQVVGYFSFFCYIYYYVTKSIVD